MLSVNSWKSGTAALMALTIATAATAPMIMNTPAAAQLFPQQTFPQQTFPQQTQIVIPAGSSLPVRYEEAEKIVVSPNETMPVTLKVAANIVNRNGTTLIPAGSQIIGQLQPADGGSQFVARELVTYQGTRLPINATSEVVSTTEISQGAKVGSILKGAVIGSAAAAAIAGVTGNRNISVGEVLIGTGAGAVGGVVLGRKSADVVVVSPDTDLDLTLGSSLALR